MDILLALAAAMFFPIVTIYGGMCAISRWARGYSGYFVFEPLGALCFLAAVGITLPVYAVAVGYLNRDSAFPLFFLMLAVTPFCVAGFVLWCFALVLEFGRRVMVSEPEHVTPSYDRGDGFMARGMYNEAEVEFRVFVERNPLDVEAVVRLGRALEGAHKAHQAVRELSAIRRDYISRRNGPPLTLPQWQDRILRVTYVLGDILTDKMGQRDGACAMYEETLQLLYGCKNTDGLRERIRIAKHGAPAGNVFEPVPERIQLN